MTWKEFVNTKKTINDGILGGNIHKHALGFFTPEGTYVGTCITRDIETGSFTAAFKVGRTIYRDKAAFKEAIAPLVTVNWHCLDKIIDRLEDDRFYCSHIAFLSSDEKESYKQFFKNLREELQMRRLAITSSTFTFKKTSKTI